MLGAHTKDVQNRTNPIEKQQMYQPKLKPQKIVFGSDDSLCFLTQPHDLVRFAVFILPTKPNQIKPQHKKNTN